MWRDLRYACRLLLRSPGFAATAILSMAFGIAACTSVFSIVNAVLLRPIPVPRPQDLVSIYSLYTAAPGLEGAPGLRSVSWPDYQDVATRTDLFEGASAYVLVPVSLDAADASSQALAELVTGNHHPLLGMRPALGRLLTPDDDRPGAAPVAVISHQLWRDRFAASPAIIGAVVRLNGHPFDIVGVMPEAFKTVLLDWGVPGLSVPLAQHKAIAPSLDRAKLWTRPEASALMVVARLRDGVTIDAASAALRVQAQRMTRDQPQRRDAFSFSLYPTSRTRFWPERRASAIDFATVLLAIVSIVLVIAVLNVANLLIARLAARQREISLRLAIGASRGRLVRQLAVEGLVLAGLGTLASVPLSIWLTQAISSVHLPFFIRNAALSLTPDWRVLAAMSLLCAGAGLLLGLLPALRAWRTDVRSGLTNVPAARGRGIAGLDLRHALAAAQVGICLVLAITAGLMGKSLGGLLRTDLGFQTAGVMLLSVAPGTMDYDATKGMAFYRDLLDRVRRLPGVEAAALAREAIPSPMRTNKALTVPSAIDASTREPQTLAWNAVSPGFFDTIRMPLVAGRDFVASDDTTAAPVAILNETAARRFWKEPGRALGQTIRLADEKIDRTIVGVARDAVYREVGEAPRPYLFLSTAQTWSPFVTLHVRAPRDPAGMVAAARRELRLLDRTLSFEDVRTLDDLIAFRMAAPRLGAGLAIGSGLAGLALALFGLYAVLSYLVSQRRTELAIRMSIGATPRDIIRFVATFGLRVTLVGLALGLAGTLAAARLLASQLRGVDPYDAATYMLVTAFVLIAALAACLLPARRAARLDPWGLLRRS